MLLPAKRTRHLAATTLAGVRLLARRRGFRGAKFTSLRMESCYWRIGTLLLYDVHGHVDAEETLEDAGLTLIASISASMTLKLGLQSQFDITDNSPYTRTVFRVSKLD